MDFTKYVWMLSNSSLFFSRSDLFEDPYEGSSSHVDVELRNQFFENIDNIDEKEVNKIPNFKKNTRKWIYINCWHMNEHESAAMWNLYSKTNQAIAVQSTYKKLYECLPQKAYLGTVKYIDYENEKIHGRFENAMEPFVHKRKSFIHERELRAIIQDLCTDDNQLNLAKGNEKKGESIKIDFEALVEHIFISPNAPSWFQTLVSEVTNKFDQHVEIQQSKLGDDPIF